MKAAYILAVILFAAAAYLATVPAPVAPLPLVPAQEMTVGEYQQQSQPMPGDRRVGQVPQSSYDELTRRIRANPEAWARVAECERRCGFVPRDDDPPYTPERAGIYAARRRACAEAGIACSWPKDGGAQ